MQVRFTLKQLRYFVATAQSGQISLAAAQENISQSAMTAAIGELEHSLGTPLFERARTGVLLTQEGHLFLQQANAVLEVAQEAARAPFRRRQDLSGELRVGSSYTVLGYFLLPSIARFQKLHPRVRITPVELTRQQIETAVHGGEMEVAVALTSNLRRPDRFETSHLAKSRRQLWVSAGHPLLESRSVGMEAIRAYPYILPLMDEGDVNAMRYWRTAKLKPSSLLQTSSMEALREMVSLGLGVTILSDMVFRPWSLDGRRIKAIPLATPVPEMEVGLLWKRGRPLSEPAEAFQDFLSSAFRQSSLNQAPFA